MDDELEIIYGLLNGMIANDLEWVWQSPLLFETFVRPVIHKWNAI